MRILEITQDGAALLSMHGDDGDGIITKDVASCAVYAFYGDDGLCVIHDTGQLSIPGIRKLAAACGSISRAYMAQNRALTYGAQEKAHSERKKKLFSILKCSDREIQIEIPYGLVAFMKDGAVVTDPAQAGPVEQLPNRVIRHHINTLNNLFSPPNAQNIPVDVQYECGEHTAMPSLIHSFYTMQSKARMMAARGDSDYMSFLDAGIRAGLFDKQPQ